MNNPTKKVDLKKWLITTIVGVLTCIAAYLALISLLKPKPAPTSIPTLSVVIPPTSVVQSSKPTVNTIPSFTPTIYPTSSSIDNNWLINGSPMLFVSAGDFLPGSTDQDIDKVLSLCASCKKKRCFLMRNHNIRYISTTFGWISMKLRMRNIRCVLMLLFVDTTI